MRDIAAETAIGPFGSRLKATAYTTSGVPVIRGSNISRAKYLDGEFAFVSEATADRLRFANALADDLVFPHRGAIGQVGIVPRDHYGRYLISTSLMRLTCNRKRVDPLFLFYFFRSPAGRHALLSHASTVGTPGIARPLSSLQSIQVPLPPIDEQQAVGGWLGALDDKIELNRRIGATCHELAHAIFRSRYRSDDPVLPHEPLGDHVEVVRGLSYTGAGLSADGMALHNLDSIYEGGGYKRDGIKRYVGDHKPRHVVEPRDLIVANTEQGFQELLIGCPALVSRRFGGEGLFSHHLYRVRPKPSSPLSSTFLYLMLLRGRLRTEIVGYANGTTVNMLPVDALQKPRFAVPPRALVEEVDALVTPLFDRAEAAEDESETLAQLRDTLLPKLVSGEVRLRATEAGPSPGAKPS